MEEKGDLPEKTDTAHIDEPSTGRSKGNSRRRRAPGVVLGEEEAGSAGKEAVKKVAEKKAETPDVERADEGGLESGEPKKPQASRSGDPGDRGDGRPQRKRRGRGTAKADPEAKEGQEAEEVAVDKNELGDRAWELFSREVQENGMEIVDDKEAKKIAARSFEIAAIFIKERSRR